MKNKKITSEEEKKNYKAKHFENPDRRIEVVNEREKGETFYHYIERRRIENKRRNEYLKRGTLVYCAVEIGEINGKEVRKSGKPFVGDTHKLKMA